MGLSAIWCYDISNWIDHGDGTAAPDPFYFRSSEEYSPIELYLAWIHTSRGSPIFRLLVAVHSG